MSTAHKQYSRKTAAILTVLAMLLALFPVAAFAAGFPDVSGTLAKEINAAAEAGIVSGYEDGTFRPNENVTRAAFAKFIVLAVERATGKALEKGDEPFSDVTPNQALYEYVVKAYKAGYIKGYGDGTFGYDKHITRQEAAAILQRALNLPAAKENFDDVADNSDFADEIGAVAAAGIMKGYDAKKFGPGEKLTRGAAAAVAYRSYDRLVRAEFRVLSVTVLNGSQLKVEFTQKVDETSAEDEANYVLTVAGQAQKNPSLATLQDDEMSVVLNVDLGLDANTKSQRVALTIKDVASQADVNVKIPVFSTTITVTDTTPPTVKSISAKTGGDTADKVTVVFSEPITNEGTYKIDGVARTATLQQDSNGAKTIVTFSGLSLAADKSHTLEILGVRDEADNVISPNPSSFTFSITKDTTAPTVSSVQPDGDRAIVVTFSEPVTGIVSETGQSGQNVSVKDELLADVDTGKAVDVSDGNATSWRIPITENLYGQKDSRSLTVLFGKGIKDSVGNELTPVTRTVTLTKDSTAPEVSSVSFKRDANGNVTEIVVTFNEWLYDNNGAGVTVSASGITVVDQNGVNRTQDLTSADSQTQTLSNGTAKGKTVTFPITNPTKLYGKYTFNFPANMVQDAAEARNGSKAYSAVIDFGQAPAGSVTVLSVDYRAAGETSPAHNVIVVKFSAAVKGGTVAGSATDPARYLLNGAQLPAGTTITLNPAMDTATIELGGGITADDDKAIFRIEGVQSLSGVTVDSWVGTVAIYDNVKPTLQSAQVVDDKTVVLTFDENVVVDTTAGKANDDFEFTVGGQVHDPGSVTVAPVSGYKNRVKVTLTNGLNLSKSLTIKTKDGIDSISDESTLANKPKANVTVTISK